MQLFVGTKALVHYKGKVLLLRESNAYEEGSSEGQWDVPGGRILPEETLDAGLLREVKEECGLEVRRGKLLDAFDGFPVIKDETCHVVRLYFLCEAKSDEVVLSQDHDAYDWIDPSDASGKILMNDIEEMLAIAKENL